MTTWGAIRLSLGVIAACLGTALMLASLPSALAGALIETSIGRSGVVERPLGTLKASPGDRAVVVDGVSARLVVPAPPEWIGDGLDMAGTSAQDIAERVGEVSLVGTMSTDAPGFLGVAPVDLVNAYLDGVSYSVAVQPAEGDDAPWPTVSVPGSAVPVDPESVDLWAAQATGTRMVVPADLLESGTLVLMRTDAEPAPAASLRLEYRVPGADVALRSTAISAAATSIGGLALILLGGFLVVGRRRAA